MDENIMNLTPDEAVDHLEHHGIIGQKWGVRRYQNPDGSLTAEGRKRRGISDKSAGEKLKKLVKGTQEKKAAKKAAKKAVKEETQKEDLKRYIRDHPKQIYRKRYDLSKEELNQLVDDINFDRKLKDVRNQEYQRDWDRVRSMTNNLGTIRNMAENAKGIYNLAVDVNNTLVDTGKMNGKKMAKIGERAPEDHNEIEKIVRTGSLEDVVKAAKGGKLSVKDLSNAEVRFNKMDSLEKKLSEQKAAESANKDNSGWYKSTSTDAGKTEDYYKDVGTSDGSKAGNWYRPDTYGVSDWYKSSSVGETKLSDVYKSVGSSDGSSASAWYRQSESADSEKKKKNA